MSEYVVKNRLGMLVAGQRLSVGDTVDLDDETAAPLVATGALEAAAKPKAKSSSGKRT